MELESPRKFKWQEVLELFFRKRTWSNFELLNLTPRIVNPPKQIFEIRKHGYNIETIEDPNDKRKIYYTLHFGGDLFA